MDRPTNTEITV